MRFINSKVCFQCTVRHQLSPAGVLHLGPNLLKEDSRLAHTAWNCLFAPQISPSFQKVHLTEDMASTFRRKVLFTFRSILIDLDALIKLMRHIHVQVNFKNKQQGDIFGYLCKSSKIAKLFTFIITTICFKEKSHSDLFFRRKHAMGKKRRPVN